MKPRGESPERRMLNQIASMREALEALESSLGPEGEPTGAAPGAGARGFLSRRVAPPPSIRDRIMKWLAEMGRKSGRRPEERKPPEEAGVSDDKPDLSDERLGAPAAAERESPESEARWMADVDSEEDLHAGIEFALSSVYFQLLPGDSALEFLSSTVMLPMGLEDTVVGDEAAGVRPLHRFGGRGEPEDLHEQVVSSSIGFWTSPQVAGSVRGPRHLLDGRYQIKGLLGAGAVSRIYHGVDRKLNRPVAIKVVPPPMSEIVRRSLEATRPLDHPSILRVDGFGTLGPDGLYLVMPLLRGATLREFLFARGQALEGLLFAFRKACEGMAHAHAREIVHRDLKPANIQVEPEGQAIVIDWGLACVAEERSPKEKAILGTPLYMAPEQLQGGPVSTRTDIYALGTILYEILTGRNPVGPGGRIGDVLYRLETLKPPPPSALCAEGQQPLARALDGTVMRCLDKNPKERFQDAGELLDELEGLPGR